MNPDEQYLAISPAERAETSITASKMETPLISIGGNSTPTVTLHRDGRLEFGPDYNPDDAARAFWHAVQRLQPTFEQQTGIKDVSARLRAGAFRDGADRIRRTDLPDNYMDIDTFEAGADWAATLMDQAAKEADPK